MELLKAFLDFILHIDIHLDYIIAYAGNYSYAILASIIFLETGVVLTPFLPGDSLLFAVGTFCARGSFDLTTILILLSLAAILGDTVNYWIGKTFGHIMVEQKKLKLIRQRHLDKTHAFFEKHGGKTIILARFVPIVRTFAPFVAGMGQMTYHRFVFFNITGALAWVFLFVVSGYFFGNQPVVRKNFTLVIFAIIFVSVMPILVEIVLQWNNLRQDKKQKKRHSKHL